MPGISWEEINDGDMGGDGASEQVFQKKKFCGFLSM